MSNRPGEVVITLAPRTPPQNTLPCTVEGCQTPRRARGLCNAHRLQAWREIRRQQREAASGESS